MSAILGDSGGAGIRSCVFPTFSQTLSAVPSSAQSPLHRERYCTHRMTMDAYGKNDVSCLVGCSSLSSGLFVTRAGWFDWQCIPGGGGTDHGKLGEGVWVLIIVPRMLISLKVRPLYM